MTITVSNPEAGIRVLTFDAPERLNAFSFAMYEELLDLLRSIRFDATVRVVIVTGAGRGFCSGHFSGGAGEPGWMDPSLGTIPRNARIMMLLGEIPVMMRQMPQPIIAAVNGAAAGVGYSIALAADIAIAGQSAKFVNAFHNAGTGHELGLSYTLPRAVGAQKAAELLLTRRPVLADEAERIGLVLKSVPDETLIEQSLELARAIAANNPMGIWVTKQSLHLNQDASGLAAAIELENRGVHLAQATGDFAELREALKEKRPPVFRNQ